MLSSTNFQGNSSYNNKTRSLNRVSPSSSSKSSSTSSSDHSPFSPSDNLQYQAPVQQNKAKTMEEVWKDISLASLHDQTSCDQDLLVPSPRVHNIQHHHHRDNPNNFILQDFLARPFDKYPLSRMVSICRDDTPSGSSVPPPATVLSLNSGPGFDFLDNGSDHHPFRPSSSNLHSNPCSNVSSFNGPLKGLDSSSGLSTFGKKRPQDSDSSSGDRKHKRMIKNRESAARSRARKQAYTNELELEVAHLLKENARLKREQEELYLAAAAQLPKKHTLQRTSTAPF